MNAQKELIAEFDRETAKTRKMLDALPADADFSFRPHPKSMALGNLVTHLADMTGQWAMSTLTSDKMELPADYKFVPRVPAGKAELLESFDAGVAKTRTELAALPVESWDRNWKFTFVGNTVIDASKSQVFRDSVLNHMIHHRAQLSVYLRLIEAKVPGIYGPSADDKK